MARKPNTTNNGNAGKTQPRSSAVMATHHGIPFNDNQNSRRAGPHGPILLNDFTLREPIFHLPNERIFEQIEPTLPTSTAPIPKPPRASFPPKKCKEPPVAAHLPIAARGAGLRDLA